MMAEFAVSSANNYAVYEGDGTLVWKAPVSDQSGLASGTAFDFLGDGVAEAMYGDEYNLFVYDGKAGDVVLQAKRTSATLAEYPVVVDVDNDGSAEILVVSSEPYDKQVPRTPTLQVFRDKDERWIQARRVWNQHTYHVTNVNDDGTIPAAPPPNWLSYNNFRSGDLSEPDGLKAPDLVMLSPESCLNECSGADQVTVWVQLGNEGAVPLTAGVTIKVHGSSMGVESLLQEVPVDIILQPGEFADAISIDVDTSGVDELRLEAVPNEAECIVDPANEIVLKAPFCKIPG